MASSFENLPDAVDTHYKIEKLRVGRGNRLTALEKDGRNDETCRQVYTTLCQLEKYLEDYIIPMVTTHPVWQNWAKDVWGVSPMLLAKAMGRCDITRLTTASKMRSHAGLRPDQSRQKGVKLDYDAELKSVLWLIGRQLRFASGVYYEQYRKAKEYYQERFRRDGVKIVATPSGKWKCEACGTIWDRKKDIRRCCLNPQVEKQVKKEGQGIIYLGHVDMMAMRKMISLFAIHLWAVWREAEGLPFPEPWILTDQAKAQGMYHVDYIPPLRDNPEQKKPRKRKPKES